MELLLLSVPSRAGTESDGYQEQLQDDARFLCAERRVDAELVERLVLQLNRTYPQILSDKEAHRFRNLKVPAAERLAALLAHLYGEGEEACHEFYRALQIHADNVYAALPTRVRQRESEEPMRTGAVAVYRERDVLNDKGPMFFLSCFSFVVGAAMLYYYGDGEPLKCTRGILHCSAARLSKDVLISYADAGKHK